MAKGKKVKVAEVTEEKDVAEVTPEEVKVTPPDVKEAGSEPEAPVETPEEEVKPEADATTTPKEEEENLPDEQVEKEIKKVEEMMVIGKVRKPIYQKSSFIKTKVLRTPPCLYELPDDIRKYLTNKGWGTNIYLKGEEWLVKHNADMNMIEKLKKFISEHYM